MMDARLTDEVPRYAVRDSSCTAGHLLGGLKTLRPCALLTYGQGKTISLSSFIFFHLTFH